MTVQQRHNNCEGNGFYSREKAWFGNKEEVTLIWLTRTKFDSQNNEEKIILKHLHEINNYVKTFDDPIICIDYMKSIKDERIFLIVGGKLIVAFYDNIYSCSAVDHQIVCLATYILNA